MKLKDLKPNECIVINSRKEALKLRKLLNSEKIYDECFRTQLDIEKCILENIIRIYGDSFYYNDQNYNNSYKEYTVKDFLPKKSKFKKDTKQELARLDNLTNDLYIRLKQLEDKPVLSCSKSLTPETLKAITEPVISAELEVGKWYKEDKFKWLVFRQNDKGNGYGFNKSKWQDIMACIENTDEVKWTLATHEEVETALIEEAKRRGFKEGVTHNIANGNRIVKNISYTRCKYDNFNNKLLLNNWCIFEKGKWATIVEEGCLRKIIMF